MMNHQAKKEKPKYPPIKGIGTLVREGLISFVRIDTAVFVKTKEEKKRLKTMRNSHNGYIRLCGCDPKKTFNIGTGL
jgi:hypothetical protein